MIRRAILTALFASLLATPALAHDAPLPLIKHVGTPDMSVRVDDRHYVQVEHLPRFVLDRAGLIDCLWFEDGSGRCD